MIAAFQAVPALKSFHSSDSTLIVDLTPSSFHPPRCVRMRNLRPFQICGGLCQGAALLRYLMLPLTCRLFIVSQGWGMPKGSADIGGWEDIRDSLRAHLATVPSSIAPSSDVEFKDTDSCCLTTLVIFCKLSCDYIDPVTEAPTGECTDEELLSCRID